MSKHDDARPRSGAAYGRRVADVLAARGVGSRLAHPHAVGEAGSAACGAMVRIELELRESIVEAAACQAYGCPATLASAHEVAARSKGASLLAAAAISAAQVSEALELAPDKVGSADLAVDALQAALTSAIAQGHPRLPAAQPGEKGVLVGMSGGVDSTVAALLLRNEGRDVVGVTLKLWDGSDDAGARSCCSSEAVKRARKAAHALGIPHLTVDATALFGNAVVDYFVDEYRRGRTPNPCAKCNSRVRFGHMVELAHRLGLSHVATGHYARFEGKARVLSRAADLCKDQSYALSEVEPDLLSHVIFPLGSMTKSEVRRIASVWGVVGFDAPESQDICFIPDGDYRKFLRARLGERPGEVVDQRGTVVGTHAGTYGFTIGQRKGLGISRSSPLYVTAIDPEYDRVVVGTTQDSAVRTVEISGITWHAEPGGGDCLVQLRSSGAPLKARFVQPADPRRSEDGEHVTVYLEESVVGVATGQTAVVYAGSTVLMAGTITAAA